MYQAHPVVSHADGCTLSEHRNAYTASSHDCSCILLCLFYTAVLLSSLQLQQPDTYMVTNACPLVAVPVNNAAFPRNPSPAYSGMACNQYLPSNTMDRFLWVINYFATNGFYVVITALMQPHVLTLFKAQNSRLPSPEKLRLILVMLLRQYLL